jgi:nucleoside phosphorylase
VSGLVDRDRRAPGAEPRLLGVVAALTEELEPLVARLAGAARVRVNGLRAHTGSLAGRPVVLAATGEGRRRAQEGVDALFERFPIERLLVVGVSGGLTPGAPEGTVLVADRLVGGEPLVPPPDPDWTARVASLPGIARGTVMTVAQVVSGTRAKAAARATLPGAEPAVVDLESAIYAHRAGRDGVPYLVIRAILDPAEEDLPIDFARFQGSDGEIDRTKVLAHAVAHPELIRTLWALRSRLRDCAVRLAEAAEGAVG